MRKQIVIGTRGSALALKQVELFKAKATAVCPDLEFEVRIVSTAGDRSQEAKEAIANGAGLKGLFTREIETLLLDGSIDLAVHSLKDLPGALPEGVKIAAVLERAATEDLLIARPGVSFATLPEGATVPTSSVRRRMQLLYLRPDLKVPVLRGNVPTRLRKLTDSEEFAAILLARAGLDRLEIDLTGYHVEEMNTLPAIGQGAIGLEIRSDRKDLEEMLALINHLPTFLCVRAEREFLRLLNGDCNLPVGARAILDGEMIQMEAIVFSGVANEPPVLGKCSGPADAPEEIASRLFKKIYGTEK